MERLKKSRSQTDSDVLPPTPEEDAAILAAAEADPDALPLTDAQLAAMVLAKECKALSKSSAALTLTPGPSPKGEG
jgi:hypothetical protein